MKRVLLALILLTMAALPAGIAGASGGSAAPAGNEAVAAGGVSGHDTAWDVELDEETEEAMADVADPIEPFNRAMYHFNDKLYFWVLKPVSQGYGAVVPEPARRGVRNFFRNLLTPVRLVNSLLQGKAESAGLVFSRFMINTTIGVAGFGMLARMQIHWPWPGYIVAKVGVWVVIGILPILVRKGFVPRGSAWMRRRLLSGKVLSTLRGSSAAPMPARTQPSIAW